MSKRRLVGRGLGRKGNRNKSFNIETLEDRRLLSAVTFGTPITTTLPNGFTPAKVERFVGDLGQFQTLVVTGTGGGAVIVSGSGDGTFSTDTTITASDTVLGGALVGDAQGASQVEVLFTTTGYMAQQQNGSFAAPAGYTLPADTVPGAAGIGRGFPSTLGSGPGLVVERFVPNLGDPTLGSIIVSTYYQNTANGTFGQHKDTTIANNVSSPAGEAFVVTNLDSDAISDIVVNGSVWFGNADGSFRVGPSLGLSLAERTASLTEGALSVNGATGNDLVLYPAPTTSDDPKDAAEVFVNDGTGTFKRGPRVDLGAAGTTSGPVLISDLNADGASDIGVVVTSGPGAPELAVAQGSANNGFIGNVLEPLPANATIVDLHPNLAPDLLAFGTKTVSGSTRSVLETIPATQTSGPIITLSPSSTSVFVGQRVVITANRSVPESPGTTYTFLDGSTVIGTATEAADGSVTFATSSLAAGAHVITAVSNFAPGDVSAPLTLSVNADPPTGLVFATGIQVGLKAVEVPGDVDSVKLSLRNIGGGTATAPLNVKLFASTTSTLAVDAIPLPDSSLSNLNPNLGKNKTKTVSAKLTMPDSLTPGTYFLIAQVVAAKPSGLSNVIATTLVDFNSFQVAWQFGHVGNRQNVKFVQHLKSGNVVTFALTGAGYGVVTPGDGPLTLGNGGPDFAVNAAQTNIKSKLTISQTGSTKSNIVSLTLNNDVGTVDVRTDTPHIIGTGPLDNNGVALGTAIVSVKQLSIGTVPAASLVANAAPSTSTVADININGNLGNLAATAINNTTIEVGANSSAPTKMKIGTLGQTAVINANVPIAELDLTTAQAGSVINAPSLGKLKTSGNFSSTMTLSGKTHGTYVLGSVDIGGSVAGASSSNHARWAINGNIGDIKIRAGVANFDLLAGARLGPLGELTEPQAAFSGVSIKSLTIGGSVSQSLLSAGLDPVDGVLLNIGDVLLPGGSFGSIDITGNVDNNNTKIVASSLPAQVTVGRQKITTASEPRIFSLAPAQ